MDDHELLREFVHRRSEDAFRQLVERHLNMVLAAARRMIGDEHLAQDVTQSVFTTLAQKARGIKPPQVIGGWLYNTTRHLAMHAVRSEQRRREREQTAVAMQIHEASPDIEGLMDQLEPSMAELEADDRDTLVLRYLEDRNLREVGAEFGISEDAARMRANRALERLRTLLGHKGVTVTSVALGTTLVASTSTAVPAGLTGAVTTTALAGTLITTATIVTMNWINAKVVAATVAAALLTGVGTYLVKQKEIERLREANQKLLAEQTTLAADREAAAQAAQVEKEELAKLKKDANELLRLRNEVSQLRRDSQAAAKTSAAQTAKSKSDSTPKSARSSITREQLAYAGYATPETALQSIVWATMSGATTPIQMTEGLAPSLLNNPEALKTFEQNRKASQKSFKSVDMLAKKTLDENNVEFKVTLNVDVDPSSPQRPPPVMILPMTRVDNSWKLACNPRQYQDAWNNDGVVQNYP